MKEINILPADTFLVVNRTILCEKDRKIITMLYQPIIGSLATSLYFTLWSDLDKTELVSEEFSHHHLMMSLRIKLDQIIVARKKLEAIGLLKSYVKKEGDSNNFVYELFAPISASEFFNHPILNIVLYNNVGKKEYDQIIKYFKMPRITLSGYEDITSNFDEVFDSVPGTILNNLNEDFRINKTGNIKIDKAFDFDLLISSFPKGLLSNKNLTKEVKSLINDLSFVYNIGVEELKSPLLNAIKENGVIDKNQLRKNVRNAYRFENDNKLPSLVYKSQPEYLKVNMQGDDKLAKMMYIFENTSPYNFLKGRNNGVKPSPRELTLLDELLIDYKLNPGVVNVLIDYVLKINNKKLTKNFVEAIASQWARLKIETVEDAMKQAKKEHKSRMKAEVTATKYVKNIKEENVPEWFDKNIQKQEINNEEEKTLQELLKEFS